MLHCSNIQHHGDNDYWQGYYKILPDKSSVVFSEINMEGYGVDKDQDGIVDEIKIKLMDEKGKEILPTDARWQEGGQWEKGFRLYFVGVEGGQHSGDNDCIMRYDVAQGYAKGNVHYMIQAPDSFKSDTPLLMFNQLTGISLCGSADGTGVNASGYKPLSLFGKATNGNCKHQFCINDKYH